MGYALYKLSKEDAIIFVKLTEKCWNGKERDLSKLNKYERAVLLKLMDEAGEYNPGERPVKKEPAAKSFSESIHKYNKWHDPKTGRFTSAPDKGFANGGAPAKKPKANVKIKHEVTDYYEGESYCQYTAYDGDKVAGYIKYSQVDDGSPYVHYIETAEEYRGQGVATKLLQQMQHDIGDNEINFGYTTDDGTKLLEKVTYTVTDKSIQAKFDKLENIKAKLDKEQRILDELWEKFDAEDTPELREQLALHGDKWQQLYDAIPGIERSLDGLKPTKRYVKMDGFEPVEKGKSKSFLDAIQKFNPYHDPKTGRFTTAQGGGKAGTGIMANIAPELKAAYDKDMLEYEMLGLDPAPLNDKYELLAVLNPGTKVSIGAMNDDVRRQTVDTVKKVVEKYPMAKEAITRIQVGDVLSPDTMDLDYFKEHPKTMAYYNRDNGALCLNPALYNKKSNRAKDIADIYQNTVDKGFHPQGTDFNAIIVHEMAHAIDNYYSQTSKANYAFEVKREVSYYMSKAKKDFSVDAQVSGLSEYATFNVAEFFAEAIAEYVCSPNPREIATMVGKSVDQRMANDKHFKREYKSLYNKGEVQ